MEQIGISIQQAGQVSGLSRMTLYRLINRNKLDTVKVGRRRLVKVASLRSLMEAGVE